MSGDAIVGKPAPAHTYKPNFVMPHQGVPVDAMQVEKYMEHNFMDVDTIAGLPLIEIGCEIGGGDLSRTSPSEPIHALLFAAAKACTDASAASHSNAEQAAETISKRSRILRSLPTTISVVPGEFGKCYVSVQALINATVEAAVVGRQPVQWAAELVLQVNALLKSSS